MNMYHAGVDKHEKILQLRQKGMTIRAIMKEMGMKSPSHVAHYLDQINEPLLRVPKSRLIAALRHYHRFLEVLRANAASDERGIGQVTVRLLDELLASFPQP